MFRFFRLKALILAASLGILHGQTPQTAQPTLQRIPLQIIPNQPSPLTGKRLVDDNDVTAFVQTSMGRVLFTPAGAFTAAAASGDNAVSNDPTPTRNAPDTPKTVVFQIGFSQNQVNKRRLKPRLAEPGPGSTSFFNGPQSQWRTNVAGYKKIVYDQVWDGISVEYQGFTERLGMRVVVAPYADPAMVRLETGTDLKLSGNGTLVAASAGAELKSTTPVVYQIIEGRRLVRNASYRVRQNTAFGFVVDTYDPAYALYIEPNLTWGTYLGGGGGSGSDEAVAAVVDAAGNTYFTGLAEAADFPTTPGAYNTNWLGLTDVFVAKLNSTGTALLFGTFLGGTDEDTVVAIALAENGDLVLAGTTHSPAFPTTSGAFDETFNGEQDGFVARLSATGSDLVYSTFLGGADDENIEDMVLDAAGNPYLSGDTTSSNYPITTGAYDETYQGDRDVIVTKLNAAGSALVYSTFIGGESLEVGRSIAVDDAGHAYIAGTTWSTDFPLTAGAYDESINGRSDAFLCKLNPAGSELVFASLVGGSSNEHLSKVIVDSEGNATILGETLSPNYPTTGNAFNQAYGNSYDLFVTQFNATGSALNFSTLLGGEGWDTSSDMVADSDGHLVITGLTYSSDFPTTPGALHHAFENDDRIFVTKLHRDGDALVFSALFGGSGSERVSGLALDGQDNPTIVGYTTSRDYPTTTGALSEHQNGSTDAIVTRLNQNGSALIFSTYIGGSNGDYGTSVAVSQAGNAYVLGRTYSASFPTTSGVFDQDFNGDSDCFVAKLDPTGAELLYSAFLGGSSLDAPGDIAVDRFGNAYITGYTTSYDYPTTVGAFYEGSGFTGDLFVTKINRTGSALEYSTYVGDTGTDYGRGIAVDADGNAYVTGYTSSSRFQVTAGAWDRSYNGGNSDAFIFKLNSAGSAMIYSTFLGDAGSDYGERIALDTSGNAYVTGETYSSAFPTTPDGFDRSHNGGQDVFIVKLNTTGSRLFYSTLLGTESNDEVHDIAVDTNGNAYVTGETSSTNFPTTPGAFAETANDLGNAFLTKLNASGTAPAYSTYLGGDRSDYGLAVAVDASSQAVVVGKTTSEDFPVTENAFDDDINNSREGYLVKLNEAGTALVYGTFIGGPGIDECADVALDRNGEAVITGRTSSAQFPTTPGAYDETQNGRGDAFVAKLCIDFAAQPEPISGPITVCSSTPGLVYSIPPVTGATGYTWHLPSGSVMTDGAGSNRITVTFGSEGGVISVTADNQCGAGIAQHLFVTLGERPQSAPYISGPEIVCRGESEILFRTPIVSSADYYRWTVPNGAVITAGQGTNEIIVTFGATAGPVTVTTQNDCGSAPGRSQMVAVSGVVFTRAPRDLAVCPGEAVHWEIATSAAEPTGFQWFKDEAPLAGETGPTLTLAAVGAADEGRYYCEVRDLCGTILSNVATLTISDVAHLTATPSSQSLGLEAPVFDAHFGCDGTDPAVTWRADPPTPLITEGTRVTMDPPPNETTRLELTATDAATGFVAVAEAWLLVSPNDGYEDRNTDGCNNVADMWELTPFWRQEFAGDPNGDGTINVLDLLYIPVSDPLDCN